MHFWTLKLKKKKKRISKLIEKKQLKRNFLNQSNFFGGQTLYRMMTHRKCWEEENDVFPKEEP